jgi:hypothetical protein
MEYLNRDKTAAKSGEVSTVEEAQAEDV